MIKFKFFKRYSNDPNNTILYVCNDRPKYYSQQAEKTAGNERRSNKIKRGMDKLDTRPK